MRAALKRKTPDEQAQWFKEQKRRRLEEGKHSNYNFDDLQYSETQTRSTGQETRSRYHWRPYAVWFEEKLEKAQSCGLDVKDSEALSVFELEAKEEWEQLLASPDTASKKIGDIWHVPLA